MDLRTYCPEKSATKLLTKSLCEKHTIVPVVVTNDADRLRFHARVLVVAMVDPENRTLIAELELFTGMKIEVVRADAKDIKETIRDCYGAES